MDELNSSPLNKAHSLARKAASIAEQGNFMQAIELYKEANENLTIVFEKLAGEAVIQKSLELQLVENDWKIHVLTLRMQAVDCESTESSTISIVKSKTIETVDKEDGDVVIVDHFSQPMSGSQFLTDSLNPNRTMFMQRQRSASTPSRNPLMPTADNRNFAFVSGRKLPKTQAILEEEILEKAKMQQLHAHDFVS